MIKKGFTLQELLITLAIIGVVAAITAPALLRIVPDENKVKYMKAYNTLTNATREILDDPVLYPIEYDNNGQQACFGLDCVTNMMTSNGLRANDSPIPDSLRALLSTANTAIRQTTQKFPLIFAHRLNLQSNPVYSALPTGTTVFTTVDGITWTFTADVDNANGHILGYNVTIDVDNKQGSVNALYSQAQTNPDRFRFRVSVDGGITPTDALGKAYLQNPTNMNAKDEDRQLAAEIWKENNVAQ